MDQYRWGKRLRRRVLVVVVVHMRFKTYSNAATNARKERKKTTTNEKQHHTNKILINCIFFFVCFIDSFISRVRALFSTSPLFLNKNVYFCFFFFHFVLLGKEKKHICVIVIWNLHIRTDYYGCVCFRPGRIWIFQFNAIYLCAQRKSQSKDDRADFNRRYSDCIYERRIYDVEERVRRNWSNCT